MRRPGRPWRRSRRRSRSRGCRRDGCRAGRWRGGGCRRGGRRCSGGGGGRGVTSGRRWAGRGSRCRGGGRRGSCDSSGGSDGPCTSADAWPVDDRSLQRHHRRHRRQRRWRKLCHRSVGCPRRRRSHRCRRSHRRCCSRGRRCCSRGRCNTRVHWSGACACRSCSRGCYHGWCRNRWGRVACLWCRHRWRRRCCRNRRHLFVELFQANPCAEIETQRGNRSRGEQ